MAQTPRPADAAHSAELAAIRRANALAMHSEALLAIAKRTLEWEAAGYIRGGKTLRDARYLVTAIESQSRI